MTVETKDGRTSSRIWNGTEVGTAAAFLLGLVVFLSVTGVAPLTAVFIACVVGIQMVAGFVVWKYLRPDAAPLESVGMAIALGTVLAALVGSIGASVSPWLWAAPSVLAAGGLFVLSRHKGWTLSRTSLTRAEWFGLAMGLPLGLLTLVANLLRYPLTWTGTWGGFHPDMVFFEALSRSIAQLGPWASIFTPGERVLYHWLSYGWAGQITVATNADPFVSLTRVLPYVTVAAGVFLVVSWAGRLSKVVWVPAMAAVLLLASGNAGVVYGSALNFDSPSQSMSALWLIAWAIVLVGFVKAHASRGQLMSWLVLLFALGAAVMLAKSSAGAVAAGSAGIFFLVGLVFRLVWSRDAFFGAVATVAGAGVVLILFIGGSQGAGGVELWSLLDRASSQQGFNPIPGREGVLAGTSLVILAIALRWASIPFLVVDRDTRGAPETVLALGLATSGLLGVIAFNGGQNELWFAAASVAPLAALTAHATSIAWAWSGPVARARTRAAGVLVLAIALTIAMWAVWMTGPSGGNVWQPSARWATPIVVLAGALAASWALARLTGSRTLMSVLALTAVVLTATTAFARLLGVGTAQLGASPQTRGEFFSMKGTIYEFIDPEPTREIADSLLAAGRIIRESDSPGLVATNMTASSDVPALSARQTLVSGTWYQAPYGPPGVTEILQQREETSWRFVQDPDESSRRALCDDGVVWVWIDPRRTEVSSWDDWGDVLFVSDEVTLLDIGKHCGG